MPRRTRKERLNIFLMKAGVERGHVVRDDVGELETFPISDENAFTGEIKVRVSPSAPPRWHKFVQSGTTVTIAGLLTQSSSALVIVEAGGRVFCVAFGSARHWIQDRHLERRFGMIVTLNTVHQAKIRSVDREEFDTVNRMTRSQTSVSSSIDSFGLDVQRDLVRSVTGEPENADFASHVTGADNLILSVSIAFGNLGAKCLEALDYYQRTTYKERYGWIDNFVRVRDALLVNTLEQALATAIQNGTTDAVYLSPPILMDTQEHQGFRFPFERKGSELHSDLRLDEFLAGRDRQTMTIEWLKEHRIREYTTDTDTPSREFPVFDAIVYEVQMETKLYVLSQGEWFEIDQNYVQTVENELAAINEHAQLQLPDAQAGETEPAYNVRAAAESNGALALLDAKEVHYGGGRSSIEICDLLTLDRNFVHIKAKTKSSALSHLFAQGLNSAQAFRDARFRELARAECPETHQHIFGDDIRVAEHAVTFGVITRATNPLREALPFFSKQSLANAARELRNMGYNVWIKKIAVGNT